MISQIVKLGARIDALKARTPEAEASTLPTPELLKMMLDDGGIICGGFAVAILHRRKSRDIDVYFKDDDKFMKYTAYCRDHPLDVCLYEDDPTEYHDITASMVKLIPWQGTLRSEFGPGAAETYATRVMAINQHNLVAPEKTLQRVQKYCANYGLKCREADLVCLVTMLGLDVDDYQTLLGSYRSESRMFSMHST
jgi:hypothetical protein